MLNDVSRLGPTPPVDGAGPQRATPPRGRTQVTPISRSVRSASISLIAGSGRHPTTAGHRRSTRRLRTADGRELPNELTVHVTSPERGSSIGHDRELAFDDRAARQIARQQEPRPSVEFDLGQPGKRVAARSILETAHHDRDDGDVMARPHSVRIPVGPKSPPTATTATTEPRIARTSHGCGFVRRSLLRTAPGS